MKSDLHIGYHPMIPGNHLMPDEETVAGPFKHKALCGMPVVRGRREFSDWGTDANKGTGHPWCEKCEALR